MRLSTVEQKKPPGRTLVVEPWAFADIWPQKPTASVCVGLRLMSQGQKMQARTAAEASALEAHPHGGVLATDAYNDALGRFCIAFGVCDPNDASRPSELFPQPDDDVFDALTARGATFIYQAIERYEIESSALAHEADDDEVDELVEALAAGALDRMLPSYAALCRRLLGYVLELIRKARASPG